MIVLCWVEDDEGWVKWWCKKVCEGELLLVLVLCLNCLDVCVIFDGYCWLCVGLLENVVLEILVFCVYDE